MVASHLWAVVAFLVLTGALLATVRRVARQEAAQTVLLMER
jgi:hypothetical protein